MILEGSSKKPGALLTDASEINLAKAAVTKYAKPDEPLPEAIQELIKTDVPDNEAVSKAFWGESCKIIFRSLVEMAGEEPVDEQTANWESDHAGFMLKVAQSTNADMYKTLVDSP